MKSRNFKLAAWSLFGVWALTAHPVQAQAQVKASPAALRGDLDIGEIKL